MNREDIIRMAREAGFESHDISLNFPKELERFAALVASAATPPQRKPLSDEEIILIVADCASSHQHTDIHFARAIERAHGIKENK